MRLRPPYRPPQLVDARTAFPGLIDLAAQSGTADVLLVRGICTRAILQVSLADQQITSAAGLTPVAPDSLQLLLQRRLASKGSTVDRHLTLVAFSDPNDLLSYTLPPEKYAREDITVYTILVSNAPTYLGLLERPDYAHLDCLTNPDVGRLIACGQPTSGLCKRE